MKTTRIRFAVSAALAAVSLVGCARSASPAAPSAVASVAEPASASPSPSATPSPTTKPTPTSTPVPPVELGYGARVAIDEPVDVRMAPSLDASIVATLESGSAVIGMDDLLGSGYLFGPIDADGLVWYPIRVSVSKAGWVGMEASDWETLPAHCPEMDVPTVLEFVQMTAAERVACLGNRELTVVADVPVSGLGGSRMGRWEPGWLAYPIGPVLSPPDGDAPIYGPVLHLAPGVELPELPPGATNPTMRLEVVLHVDDPAADQCMIEISPTSGPEDPEAVRQYCRTQVVATSLRPVP